MPETSFPASLDDFPALSGSATLKTNQHARKHNWVQEAIEALELKVGADGSVNETSLDYRLGVVESGGGVAAPERDTAANLASDNPVLDSMQFGFAYDTGVLKIGDGSTAWNDLPSRMPERPEPLVAVSTAAQSGISAATDITGLSIGPFTVASRPWRVMVIAGYVFGSVAGVTASVLITDLSNAMTALTSETCRGTNDTVGLPPAVEIITTPGTYSRKARLQTNTGTAGINAGIAGISATIIAEEL